MRSIKGIGASQGFAFGLSYLHVPNLPAIDSRHIENIDGEIARFKNALAQVDSSLAELESQTAQKIGEAEAEVFAAHRLFLVDPSFRDEIEQSIRAQSIQAEAAVQKVTNNLRETFENMSDDYFRARAADVMDVGTQVVRALLGLSSAGLGELKSPVIVIADELTPSDTARMDKSLVLGFVTARGGKSAHAAILARSLGIPAIVGAGEDILNIAPNTSLILDGEDGLIVIDPDEQSKQNYVKRQQELQTRLSKAFEHALEPAITLDGIHVEVFGNIGSVGDATRVVENGGEGVGLLRTEFLFLERTTAPTEDEQTETYIRISEALNNRPLIIRTLDVGGDKPLPYIPMPKEDNPFLGNRGIRLCLGMPALFKTQLSAILRAAHGREIKIMFPMVANVDEIRAAKKLLEEARSELKEKKQSFGNPQIGIMVEIPAAAVSADLLASEVDFFSIGTNDLTQYTLAADRTNPAVQSMADHFHPSVLRLIRLTIEQAHARNVWVGLCGELAGDPLAAPLLLGMGLDEFSMSSASIPSVKEALRLWSKKEASKLVDETLCQPDAQQVIGFLRKISKR